jgi:hypothetical protein
MQAQALLRGLADRLTSALSTSLYLVGAGAHGHQVRLCSCEGFGLFDFWKVRTAARPRSARLLFPAMLPLAASPTNPLTHAASTTDGTGPPCVQAAFPASLDPCTALGTWAALCFGLLLTTLVLAASERRARTK